MAFLTPLTILTFLTLLTLLTLLPIPFPSSSTPETHHLFFLHQAVED
jgi:hypothetical protein